MTTATSSRPDLAAAVTPAVEIRLQALLAMAIGVVIVGFVGFSHLEAVHNAAHDTRHANAFPCH
ncbi:CbtB-domain containing protein [uncultured Enterovirga sp.]|uniref:CbtB domain-containing protein n=1 Tax=uncultured Enterovirga sp. TaxID=2026352 RepID=UPI0035C987A5